MRKAILAFVMVAIVAASQPAGAVDDGFRGRYRLIARHVAGFCFRDSYRHPVDVRYVNERVRQFGHPRSDRARRFRYMRPGAAGTSFQVRFPWRHTRGGEFKLRYDPATDSAVGVKRGLQGCTWRVRLVPIG